MAQKTPTGHPQTGKARPFTVADARAYLKRGYDALNRQQFKDAVACCQLVLKYLPKTPEAHFLVGLIGIETRDWGTATRAFKNVVSLKPDHAAGWAQLARAFVTAGQYGNAEIALARACALDITDPLVMDVVGTVYSLLGDQKTALSWYDKAAEVSEKPVFELSRAKALTFLGKLEDADVALDRVLAVVPDTAQAHWMKSRLKKYNDHSHLNEMQVFADGVPEKSEEAAFYQYAIGKEYEDLEEWDSSFAAYERGATARRATVNYDEAAEGKMFDALTKCFSREWLAQGESTVDDLSPIFIVGQPRTGTTLIERILTAHTDVISAGELQQFAMSVKRLSGVTSPKPMTAEIIEQAVAIDPSALGQLYLDTSRVMRGSAPRFVDKMPVNYLYVPLIAKALPGAKIIHVTRDPVDSCFASYKQLFAEAYFHSYKQEEMARHHVRYRKLMDHWHTLLGDRVHVINYEETVADIEPAARALIGYLGLDWQEACLDFHAQEGSVTTASAAQVREKAHTRSVGRWRKYEAHLQPMIKILRENEII